MKNLFLLLLIITITAIPVIAAQPSYMSAFWKYTEAASSKNPDLICSAVDALDAALPSPSNSDEYNKMVWATFSAAKEYEIKGNFEKALYYLQKFVKYATWLQENSGQNHAESIKFANATINHLSLTPEIYVSCASPADVPYYNAKYEPRYGTFLGTCNDFDPDTETAHLVYVRFFDEQIESFSYLLPSEPVYTMIAWNFPEENKASLERVANGSADDYIISNLKYLATLPHKILLRFGAEINCWAMPSDMAARDQYIETFKAAFRHISELARKYAPNAAMVYSPIDVSNMYVTPEDFYPGDQYVDWVGMSTYYLLYEASSNKSADQVDAYYCRGLYDNPMVKVRQIVETFGDRKPILISECGFGYAAKDGQNPQYAVKKLKEFFTYLNMVHPEIKGILYFDTNFERDYKLSGCPELLNTYKSVTANNFPIQALKNGTTVGYNRFSTFEGNTKKLDLYAHAAFPSANPVTVSYTIDGKTIPHENQIPYKAVLDVSSLSQGKHTLSLKVICGTFNKSYDYTFYVGDNCKISQKEITPVNLPFTDVKTTDWFYNDVKNAYNNNLINGKTPTLYRPDDNITYAEAIKIASCMHQLYYEKKVSLTNGTANWYDNYVKYALDNHIITGDIAEKADTTITRGDFVSIFYSALPEYEYPVINHVSDNAIPDVPMANESSHQIYAFYRAGILTGSDGGYFNPQSYILRSEVAAILTRMSNKSARRDLYLV
ncbi:MAG: S-layer homology domain-containing protein [Clostridia bacterium]|nr:S-layer homology domain-containing protein [Clostridia bacterium]